MRRILDYNATVANTGLPDSNLGSYDGGPIAPTKPFETDVLFTYLLHPRMAVCLGCNNGYSDLSLRPGPPPFVTAQGAQQYDRAPFLH